MWYFKKGQRKNLSERYTNSLNFILWNICIFSFQETDIVCFWSISKAIFEAFQGPQIRLSFYVKQYYIITFADWLKGVKNTMCPVWHYFIHYTITSICFLGIVSAKSLKNYIFYWQIIMKWSKNKLFPPAG